MYQSLYRKYRPTTFDEIIGQKVIVKTLKNSILQNKINHAYLFTGPRGTGKTSIAKILAKTINCENLEETNPCNKCVSCTQIINKQSVDILEIDAASNNGVDEIRELNSKVNLVPSVGKYKVYIIDEVHMLTVGAFNALLKTLEEPPSHIVFILATTEPHKIPATILSRCQRFDFKKLNTSEIHQRLEEIVVKEKINISGEAITEIAKLSDGGMRDSLSMLDQVIAYASDNITINDVHEVNGTITKEELKDFIKLLLSKKLEDILFKVDLYDENGKDFIKLTEEIIEFTKNILLNMVIPNYLVDDMNKNVYEEINNNISEKELLELIKEFNDEIINLKNSNNAKLIFELLLIKIMTKTKKTVDIKTEQNKHFVNDESIKIKKKEKIIENEDNNSIIVDEQIKNIKKIRINNTLCSFDKKMVIQLKNTISNLMSLMLNQKYGDIYSMILDGELKAFGNNTMIFVYQSNRISNEFNNNIIMIDEFIRENINKDFKAISTYQEEWNIIKNNFNNKKVKYTYIEEPKIELPKEENENDIDELFDEIVEYN